MAMNYSSLPSGVSNKKSAIMSNLPLSNAAIIMVDENTKNLESIQNFPVISGDGITHIHQDPVTGQRYSMTDEFHQRIPQILAARNIEGTNNNSISSVLSINPNNLFENQMGKSSIYNFNTDNSNRYYDKLYVINSNTNDSFFKAAMNSPEYRGNFFFMGENSLLQSESTIFNNQRLFLNELYTNQLENITSVVSVNNSQFNDAMTKSENANQNTTQNVIKTPTIKSRYAYPSFNITQQRDSRVSPNIGVSSFYSNRHAYPQISSVSR